MARTKSRPGPSITIVDMSTSSTPAAQDRDEDEEQDMNGNSDQSDLESLPAPPPSKKSKPVAKRKPRKSAPAKSIPTSPTVASSSATTPQPEPGPRRKGGNKRKWTHEYCLTCTRYGRACGGRREGEEGCAVCRDPDRSKGEKLRECLWADHEAGITDYDTARAIFKKAQAEARAQRTKSKKRQTSNAPVSAKTPRASTPALESSIPASTEPFAAVVLPETTRPLDLLPPTFKRSSNSTQRRDTSLLDNEDNRAQLVAHSSVANEPHDHFSGVHHPELYYVSFNSDNEEKVLTTGQSSRRGTTSSKHQATYLSQSDNELVGYFHTGAKSWVKPKVAHPSQKVAIYYAHPYRSAYDAPPIPPPHILYQGDNGRQINAPRMRGIVAPGPATPPFASLDSTDGPRLRWPLEEPNITNFDGDGWKVRSRESSDSLKIEKAIDDTNQNGSRAGLATSLDDSSSLSSYVSIDEDDIDDIVAGKSQSLAYIASPTSHLKRKFDATLMGSTGQVSEPNPADNAVLHINFGTGVTPVSAELPSRTHDNKRLTIFQQSVAVTFPGEITIQEDEEAGASSSDSELTSDEGKLKTLPSKLRGLLSRSRITKVIVGDDIFEIRPKTKASSKEMQKAIFGENKDIRAGEIRGKGRKRARKSISEIPVIDHEDESEEEMVNGDTKSVQTREEETRFNRPPIKIKLIFKPKTTVDPRDIQEPKNKSTVFRKEAVDASILDSDTELDGA